MTDDCEFLVRVHNRGVMTELSSDIVLRCTLTGKCCFCDGVSPNLCTRRTFSLEYEAKHTVVKGESINPTITD